MKDRIWRSKSQRYSRIHTVGDGAEWILLQSREVFGEQAHFLCDFFHVSEYLGAAAPVCRPAQPDQWRRTQQRRLKSGAAIKVIEALEGELEPQTTPEQEAPVRQGHRYLSNRLDQLDYAGALALGLPIGSGMIESGHRHVLQARLKKAGAAWLSDHADQIAHLRVPEASEWRSHRSDRLSCLTSTSSTPSLWPMTEPIAWF